MSLPSRHIGVESQSDRDELRHVSQNLSARARRVNLGEPDSTGQGEPENNQDRLRSNLKVAPPCPRSFSRPPITRSFTTTNPVHCSLHRRLLHPKMRNVLTSATITLAAAVLSVVPDAQAAYNLVQAWQGQSFFDGWDFYGSYDNLTNVSPL